MSTQDESSTPTDGWTRSEVSGLAVGFVWALGILTNSIFTAFNDEGVFVVNYLMVVIALLPVILIWLWARSSVQARELYSEIDGLTARLVSLRKHVDALEDSLSPQNESDGLIEKINQIAQAQEKTDTTLAVFMSSRSAAANSSQADAADKSGSPKQATLLPVDMVNPQAPLSHEDFVRAANFPHNTEDRVGFAVLRLALENDKTSPFLRASQDILTLLSQEGVYMDDLVPEKTRPESWRHFGQGKRGKAIAQLGGIRDRIIIERVSGRMREDMVFRDAVHHFLRKFDMVFTEFCEDASDDDLVQFSETRSGRAFMLLGRIAGTFD
ncbi:MAG: hypothetical protein P8L32_01555 [Paracoccaceae bacterium]|jgi:hypothetical protein|nr:hypothetical protein [Paracoccaceae bacterium]